MPSRSHPTTDHRTGRRDGEKAARLLRLAMSTLLLLLGTVSLAQPTPERPIIGKASILLVNDQISCGVALHFVEEPMQSGVRILTVNSGIRMTQLSTAWCLSSWHRTTCSSPMTWPQPWSSTRDSPVESGWMRVKDNGGTRTPGGVSTVLEPVAGRRHSVANADAMPVLMAVLAAQPIEVGVQLAGRTEAVIKTGTVLIRGDERLKVQSCLDIARQGRRN